MVTDTGDGGRRPRSLVVVGVRTVVDMDPIPVDEWDRRQDADVRAWVCHSGSSSTRRPSVASDASSSRRAWKACANPWRGGRSCGLGIVDRLAVPGDVDVHRLLAPAGRQLRPQVPGDGLGHERHRLLRGTAAEVGRDHKDVGPGVLAPRTTGIPTRPAIRSASRPVTGIGTSPPLSPHQ